MQQGRNIAYKSMRLKYIRDPLLVKRRFYTLSFEYLTEFEDDVIEFAFCVPYTYTQMQQFIEDLKK